MRLPLLTALALVSAACAAPPAPLSSPPLPPPEPRAAAPAPVAPAAPLGAPPGADEGPPPQPPMAVRWTFRVPSQGGRAWRTRHLAVNIDGDATWEDESGGGDGDLDETLAPAPAPRAAEAQPATGCHGHVGPRRHRALVEAARKAMASGCPPGAPHLDAATTTLAVTWEGAIKSCSLAGSGGSYAAFERLRVEAVAVVCGAASGR